MHSLPLKKTLSSFSLKTFSEVAPDFHGFLKWHISLIEVFINHFTILNKWLLSVKAVSSVIFLVVFVEKDEKTLQQPSWNRLETNPLLKERRCKCECQPLSITWLWFQTRLTMCTSTEFTGYWQHPLWRLKANSHKTDLNKLVKHVFTSQWSSPVNDAGKAEGPMLKASLIMWRYVVRGSKAVSGERCGRPPWSFIWLSTCFMSYLRRLPDSAVTGSVFFTENQCHNKKFAKETWLKTLGTEAVNFFWAVPKSLKWTSLLSFIPL